MSFPSPNKSTMTEITICMHAKHNNDVHLTASCLSYIYHFYQCTQESIKKFWAWAGTRFVALCSFFPGSLTVFHRGRQPESGGRQLKSSRAGNRIISSYFKGQKKLKWLFQANISSKKRTNKFYFTTKKPKVDLFSFVFWRKLKTP